VYAEMMMIEAMQDVEEGVRVGGELVKDVKFADDQGMVASTEQGLQQLINTLETTAKNYDMRINVKKTKTMLVSKEVGKKMNIIINGQVVEQVSKFKYLGAMITEDGRSTTDVRVRIGMAKDAFSNRKELLTKRMSKDLKKKIVKTIVWPVALYGGETWTLRKEETDRLNAFEMWIWRKMEKVSWKDHITNEAVLKAVGEKRCLVENILRRKKGWMGHVLRGGGLLRDVIEGRMEGKRPRGRPRMGMIDDLKGGSYVNMKRRAEDRDDWRCWTPWTCQTAEH
jgi:hypothetical protein